MLFFCIMVSLSDQRRKIFSSLRTHVIMMYNLFILMLLPLMHKRSFPWFSFNSELIFTTLPVFSLHLWSVFMDVLPHSNIQEILPLLLFGEWARRPCRWRKFPISWLSETSLMAQQVKNPPMRQEAQKKQVLIPGSGISPGGRSDNPLQYSCLEKSQGQRSLEGYSPWGRKVRHDWVTEQHKEISNS